MTKLIEECLGCKLANSILPSNIVVENDLITCFLDIAPLNEGHILILPKGHFLDLDDLDDATSIMIIKTSAYLSKAIKSLYKPDGITIIQNGGKFNDLGHYHMHVIPRYEFDGFSWIEPKDKNNAKGKLEQTKEKMIGIIKTIKIDL
jgi:histidine triad (HIT) family protein